MPSHFNLRDYQKECVEVLSVGFRTPGNHLAVLPPGSGKSAIFSKLISLFPKAKILVLTNQNKLITQGLSNIQLFSVKSDIGVYNAGLKRKELDKPITVASIQSIYNVDHHFDLIIVDEAHRFDFKKGMFSKFYKNHKSAVYVGFTATPFDNKQYIYGDDKLYPEISYEKTFKEMTDRGCLVPLKHTSGRRDVLTNIKGIKKIAGDYAQGELSDRILSDMPKIKQQVIDALSKCEGQTVWMAVTIEHAEVLHSLVPDSILVHSQTKQTITDFETGKVQHVVSVMMLTEGVDMPSAQTLVLMRPTKSPRLYVQAVGRILRPYPGKSSALLLDYGHVIENLGSVYDVKIDENVPMKLCDECETFCFSDSKVCGHCGGVFFTQCGTCWEMKPYGESCLNCEKVEKEKRDYNESLSTKSYTGELTKKINKVTAEKYTAKSGLPCLLVKYWSGFRVEAKEYFNNKGYGDMAYSRWLHQCTEIEGYVDFDELIGLADLITVPVEVVLTKNGKYWNISEKVYVD